MNQPHSCYARFAIFPAILMAVSLLHASYATSQDYPAKPIRLLVTNTPGTPVDLIARIVGPEMSKVLGQPIVVENRPGADQLIGMEYVAKQAPADGYTIIIVSVSQLATLPITVKDLRFDPLNDLPPFASLVEQRIVLGTSPKAPWRTLDELVSHAKANPGKLNYGAVGVYVRLLAEALIRPLGLDIVHVPYSGGSQYAQGLTTGEVHMGFIGETIAIGLGDKLRVLATTGDQRRAPYLNVPTLGELGHPHIRGSSYSLNARARTPKQVINRLYGAAAAAMQQSEVRASFTKQKFEILEQSPEGAAKRLAEEARLFPDIARKVGIEPK